MKAPKSSSQKGDVVSNICSVKNAPKLPNNHLQFQTLAVACQHRCSEIRLARDWLNV